MMFNRKTVAAVLVLTLCIVSFCFAQSLEDNWNDFLHYAKIGRLDLAAGYAQAVLESEPNAIELLALSEENPVGLSILLRVNDTTPNAELTELSGKILNIIEQGRFIRRTDPKIITEEIKRLSGTNRGRVAAIKRLQNAGEYAIVYMLEAMAEDSRKKELPNIIWALPQIGRDGIRPLAAALQTENVAVKIEIIKALGSIGHPRSMVYLKYIVENSDSAELRKLAEESIRTIDSSALKLSAAQLFYQLAENYYYHAESLTPAEKEDFANIWFWDPDKQRLVRENVDKIYFNELMAMRLCEWALKADPEFGKAIGLWLAAYFKAESVGVDMPSYFGPSHAEAIAYATTAGVEYLHQGLARAIKDKNSYVALGVIEALAATAGEKSLFYRIGTVQPLIQALSFDDKAIRYSAAIAIVTAGPKEAFAESKLVVKNLAQALEETDLTNKWNAESYALRAVKVMLKSAQARNTVIDLSAVEDSLIKSTKMKNTEIQVLAAQTLALMGSENAQRSIADMALKETNTKDIQILAFDSLATSAKVNANLLDDKRIDAIYSLVSSEEIDSELRNAASSAYGALNLPSQKVKDLILDQARS